MKRPDTQSPQIGLDIQVEEKKVGGVDFLDPSDSKKSGLETPKPRTKKAGSSKPNRGNRTWITWTHQDEDQ